MSSRAPISRLLPTGSLLMPPTSSRRTFLSWIRSNWTTCIYAAVGSFCFLSFFFSPSLFLFSLDFLQIQPPLWSSTAETTPSGCRHQDSQRVFGQGVPRCRALQGRYLFGDGSRRLQILVNYSESHMSLEAFIRCTHGKY